MTKNEEQQKNSILFWITENEIKNENGNPIEFEDHNFMLDVYSDRSPVQVIRKGSQVGASTMEILRAFHAARFCSMPGVRPVIPRRAGFFYDPEPAEDKVRDFFGISFGSGVAYKQWIFDVAYELRWADDEDASNLIATGNRDAKQDVYQHSILRR